MIAWLHTLPAELPLMLHQSALLWLMLGCFCRLRRTDRTTLESIRLVFWLLFCAAAILFAAPVAHTLWPRWCSTPYEARWPVVALLWAIVAVQYVTAAHWRKAVPQQYRSRAR